MCAMGSSPLDVPLSTIGLSWALVQPGREGMHSVSESSEVMVPDLNQVVTHLATLIVEGRLPSHRLQTTDMKWKKPRPYGEGVHCPTVIYGIPKDGNHRCQDHNSLCLKNRNLRAQIGLLESVVMVEVYLAPDCFCAALRSESTLVTSPPGTDDVLLEQWHINVFSTRSQQSMTGLANLYQAIRSSLHFSQLAAWYVSNDGRKPAHIVYRVCSVHDAAQPNNAMVHHRFPVAELDRNISLMVSVVSLPRMETLPTISCSTHPIEHKNQADNLVEKFRSHIFPSSVRFSYERKLQSTTCDDVKLKSLVRSGLEETDILDGLPNKCVKDYTTKIKPTVLNVGLHLVEHMTPEVMAKKKVLERLKLDGCGGDSKSKLLDDRMHISCPVSGKHHCEHLLDEDPEQALTQSDELKPRRRRSISRARLQPAVDMFQPRRCVLHGKFKDVDSLETLECANSASEKETKAVPDTSKECLIGNTGHDTKKTECNAAEERNKALSDSGWDGNPFLAAIMRCAKKNTSDVSTNTDISFARYSPDATFVLKKSTALKLPLPQTTPLATKSVSRATSTELNAGIDDTPADDDSQQSGGFKSSDSPVMSPCVTSIRSLFSCRRKLSSLPLLGSFEESALRGRLEPVCTVDGFTAELGASGSFFPPHLQLPVTVSFFSTREDFNGTTPYLGHMSLDRKGYNVPRSGTIQVTLFNPQKTVVHVFVVHYDLNDMPPNSCTFIRQRSHNVPSTCETTGQDWQRPDSQVFSKYLIHLRFCSSKTGKINLHTDVRFLIFNKADADTASVIRLKGVSEPHSKLLTQTTTPNNPKFSPKQLSPRQMQPL